MTQRERRKVLEDARALSRALDARDVRRVARASVSAARAILKFHLNSNPNDASL
jgi:hypothetical protein